MAYFYFDFRDTTIKTSDYNVVIIRNSQNPERGEGGRGTHVCHRSTIDELSFLAIQVLLRSELAQNIGHPSKSSCAPKPIKLS